jgi:TRAF3-interacting protein 1
MAEIDGSIVKRTQETLGKYVKRPPLTEKLLLRPPFRFLHDIVTMASYILIDFFF